MRQMFEVIPVLKSNLKRYISGVALPEGACKMARQVSVGWIASPRDHLWYNSLTIPI
jgi:hypothetical protein